MRTPITLGRLMVIPLVVVMAIAESWPDSNTQPLASAEDVEWLSYGRDLASSHYSPLEQIDGANISQLRPTWSWDSVDMQLSISISGGEWLANSRNLFQELIRRKPNLWSNGAVPTFLNLKATPLMVGRRLLLVTPLSVGVAIDATNGRTLWSFNPKSYESGTTAMTFARWNQRGGAYWTNGSEERFLWGTGDGYLVAVDALTGRPIDEFGQHGRVDLLEGLPRADRSRLSGNNAFDVSVQSPPTIVGNVVIAPSSITSTTTSREAVPGWIRGYDVRNGALRWTFRTIPHPGEPGNESWGDSSWSFSGKVNSWAGMSADSSLGYLYVPVATAAPDHYGAFRPGDNLFADTLLCLDALTGQRVWHFQFVHHGLWDYDPPAPPNLIDIRVNGTLIRAVAQVTKQGFVFVLNRETGKPVWPILEKPVPISDAMPGERPSITQPFPSRPLPFESQGMTVDDLIDFTPALRREAIEVVSKYRMGPLYSPPSLQGTIQHPGIDGGANWQGASVDPESGILYLTSINDASVVAFRRPLENEVASLPFIHNVFGLPRVGGGLPILKPPYSQLLAIDLNSGDIVWRTPLGNGKRYRDHPLLRGLHLPPLGDGQRSGVLVTKSLVVATTPGSGRDDPPRLIGFDKKTGRERGSVTLIGPALGSPFTFMIAGRQVIAVTAMGKRGPTLVAFSLS